MADVEGEKRNIFWRRTEKPEKGCRDENTKISGSLDL